MLVSVKHQHDSAIGMPISTPSWTSPPPPIPATPLGCYRAPVWVPWVIQQFPSVDYFISHMVMYMFPCYSLHISPSSSPRPVPMSISLFSMFSQFFKVPFALNSQSWASQAALVVENLPANAGDIRDVGLIPGSGRSPGGGHGNPFHGQRSLVGYSPWGHKELDTTEAT